MRRWRLRRIVVACAAITLLTHCGDNRRSDIWIHVPPDLATGAQYAVDDLAADLGRITNKRVATTRLNGPACKDGEIHILMLGHEHDAYGRRAPSPLDDQEYTIHERRCGKTGREITLRGGGLMSAQWAVYELLEQLGVRYFHPEQTFYPETAQWPADPIDVDRKPRLFLRSMHAHRTHPIELSAPTYLGDLDMAAYQKRWIDWNVKMRQTEVDGWDSQRIGNYAYERGFPRGAGFNLLNTQQGGRPLLDPDDPRPESQQIADAIDARMVPVNGLPDVSRFGFQFNPSEFTEADHQKTVNRLNFITNYITEHYPGVDIQTIYHGTHEEPGPLGPTFFQLSELAPPALSVETHTLMFYDLERPAAGIYGNDSFADMLAWIRKEAPIRRIIHYPESSWWLTFDEPVPLYLAPVTLEARQHDLDLLEPLLSENEDQKTGVWGHHIFTSGQEWGYWLIDYCVAQMDWDLSVTYHDCEADFTSHLAHGDQIQAVLDEVTTRQITDMRDPEILRFLVGSDDETEAAADVGILFHPLPPPPASVLGWSDEEVAKLEQSSLTPLRKMVTDYDAWADRVEATLPDQSPQALPLASEIRDGLRIFARRAEHAVTVYQTVLDLRAAIQAGDAAAIDTAKTGVNAARAITEKARTIVERREADYRYPPALTIDGDEPGTPGAVENATIYPYRYLSRTHRMFYWTRPDDQISAMFGDGLELVSVSRRIFTQPTAIDVTVLADDAQSLTMDWGDGSAVETTLTPHTYGAEGFYRWTLEVIRTSGILRQEDDAVACTRRMAFAKGSIKVVEPSGATLVEGLLPGFVVGLGDDGTPFMAIGRIDGSDPVSAKDAVWRRDRSGMTSGPADMDITLNNIGELTVYGAIITVADGSGPTDRRLSISGELSTDEIVATLVSVGGFDEMGAKQIVADVLGYTVDTLPARVTFQTDAVGAEE